MAMHLVRERVLRPSWQDTDRAVQIVAGVSAGPHDVVTADERGVAKIDVLALLTDRSLSDAIEMSNMTAGKLRRDVD